MIYALTVFLQNKKENKAMYKYKISEARFHKAVLSFTKKIMAGQKEWNKNQELAFVEYLIDNTVRQALKKYQIEIGE